MSTKCIKHPWLSVLIARYKYGYVPQDDNNILDSTLQ